MVATSLGWKDSTREDRQDGRNRDFHHGLLRQEVPTNEVIGYLALVIFIFGPPFFLLEEDSKEGMMFLLGDNPLRNFHLLSAVGGAICGVSFGREMKFMGFVSGIVSSLGGAVLFWYYAFHSPVIEFLFPADIAVLIGLGSIPGFALYLAATVARSHFARPRSR